MKKFLLTAFSALALTFGAQAQDTYVPLTDASQLTNGTECIIVANDGATTPVYYVMSTNQATNNRTGAKIDVNPDGSITIGENTQVIYLDDTCVTGSWVLKTAAETQKCLKGGTASKNQLTTATALPTAAGSSTWKITIASDGTTDIVAELSGGRNNLRFNPNNGNPIFACYSTGQIPVTMYVKKGEPTVTMTPGFEGYVGGKGIWWDATNVKLNLEEGAVAYYTTDGTEPTLASTAYDAATGIAIAAATEEGQTMTIKAVAKKGDLEVSPVAELVLTAAKPYKYIATTRVIPGVPYRWIVNAGTAEAPDYKINTQTATGGFYVLTEQVELTDGSFTTADKSNAITFTATEKEGEYLMQQGNGEYLFMDESHNSFNHTSEAPTTDIALYNNYLWTVTAEEDGTVKIANVGRTYTADDITAGMYAQYSVQYKSFASSDPAYGGVLPALYAPEEMLVVDPELTFPEGEEQTVKVFAFTTIDAAKATTEGFSGNISYAVLDKEGNALAQDEYSLMIADGMLNVQFKKAGTYTIVATSEAHGLFLAGRAETKFIVEKIATEIAFAHENFYGQVDVEITTLDQAVVTLKDYEGTETYNGTVTYELSGEGLTADDYTFDLTGNAPKLTVKKEGVWTMTATAPATDAFEASSTTATVTITKQPVVVPAEPVAKVGETTLTTDSEYESEEAVEVTLTCETEGAKIYYLLTPANAVEPEAEAEFTLYSEPIKVEATSTLKVYSELDDIKSESKTYSIQIAPAAPAAPVVRVGEDILTTDKAYESEKAVEVTLSTTTEGAKLYYLLTPANAPAPTEEAEYTLYEGAIKVEATSTLSVYAENNGVKSEVSTYTIEIKPGFVAMTIADLDNAEVYSLQGMRVSRPEAGKIYIIRQGGRTYKAIVK